MTAVKKTTLPKEVSDLTEEQALRQMKQGSQDALAWFIHRYGAYVSTIIHNIIGQRMSNADVEEVASDVFLALWNNAGKILPNAARSWLATVARNTARSRLRRASDTLPLDEEAVIVDDRTPEATLERREQAVRVRMALLSLNPVHRGVPTVLLLLSENRRYCRGHGAERIHRPHQAEPRPGEASGLSAAGGQS